MSLAIEELVTNCIKYGYQDANGHTIDFLLSVDEGVLSLEVVDDGNPFNASTLRVPICRSPGKARSAGLDFTCCASLPTKCATNGGMAPTDCA